jgi:1-aminocyclopropane-1-carboxylate deaminase/D-cysteine desulfhydrase-like pyridoxal-dependent ACC family enzyme
MVPLLDPGDDSSLGQHVTDSRIPLFERCPKMRALPHVALGSFPTPVARCDDLAVAAGAGGLWVKRDDLSGELYGGNKVRKLEFLLGEALAAGATDVITFGAAGSNHALATAIYGAQQSLKVHSMLIPQHDAPYVGRNLRASVAVGADLHPFADADEAMRGAAALRKRLRAASGREPLVIPFGGTTPGSTVGFVNAAFELAEQVEAGELPEPDLMYVTLGSMGTAAGLVLGLRAAGLRTRVVAVPVITEDEGHAQRLLDLVLETQALLAATDPSFPVREWGAGDFDVASGFVGDGYAVPTEKGNEAVALAAEACGLKLEGTYTAKTLSALLAHGRSGALEGRNVVFWNTYNSRDITPLAESGDPALLPEALRQYVHDGARPRC